MFNPDHYSKECTQFNIKPHNNWYSLTLTSRSEYIIFLTTKFAFVCFSEVLQNVNVSIAVGVKLPAGTCIRECMYLFSISNTGVKSFWL